MITYERKHRRLYECLKNARAGASAQCDLILSSATISASVKGQLPERALALLAEPSVITCSATFSASVKAHMPERVHSVQPRMRVEPLPHRALALLVEMHFSFPCLFPPPLLQAGTALLSSHCSTRREVGGTPSPGARRRTLTRPCAASGSVGFACVWLCRLPFPS